MNKVKTQVKYDQGITELPLVTLPHELAGVIDNILLWSDGTTNLDILVKKCGGTVEFVSWLLKENDKYRRTLPLVETSWGF